MTSNPSSRCDIAIVGGGLAGGLAALALAAKRPELDVRLVEAGPVGGNHIWSFFDSDIAKRDRWLVAPLVRHHWPAYHVRFPGHHRTLRMGYKSIPGEALAEAVAAALPDRLIADRALHVAPGHVLLAAGGRLDARHVIDARGAGNGSALTCGWQKFVGQALRVKGGHGLAQPVVMDAAVEQLGGYRFVYLLPLDAETIFVEDTCYSDAPDLDVAAVRERIQAYAASQGWKVAKKAVREESGVLPVVIAGDFDRYWPPSDRTARIGVRAGAFHATTGYSLPDAVRTATALPELIGPDLPTVLRERAAAGWRRQRFYRMLGAMLFRAAAPDERYRIFERFYRLPPGLIARFYAGRSRPGDKLRLLAGKPPVPVGRAIAALRRFDWR